MRRAARYFAASSKKFSFVVKRKGNKRGHLIDIHPPIEGSLEVSERNLEPPTYLLGGGSPED